MSSADNFYKKLDVDQAGHIVGSDLNPNCLTQIKYFLEKVDFEKKKTKKNSWQQKSMHNYYPEGKELMYPQADQVL